uniref:Pol-like protein n=1 Tax=Phallusia mammillata TaxID=59560 RepID=A0A6F9DM83_9ASCI|nr:pol-like protein [Phallusia mammillata]
MIFDKLASGNNPNLIIGGDFNAILQERLDKSRGPSHPNRNSRQRILSHINTYDLCDVFRRLHPAAKKYSRLQLNPFCATRIDFFLTSNLIFNKVTSSDISVGIKSDHKIISLGLKFSQSPRGSGYWKLNTNLLSDNNYISKIQNTIRDFKINNASCGVNPHVRWDALKAVIRGETIQYSAIIKRRNSARQRSLERNIENAERELTSTHQPNPDLAEKLDDFKTKLDKFSEIQTKGAMIRSRARWVENGERNSKYFLNLEKRHSAKKSIEKLNIDGVTNTDQNTILNELVLFYEQLYQQPNNPFTHQELLSRLSKLRLPSLNQAQLEDSELPITEKEFYATLISMPLNKSPGLDGFPIEFFKTFWDDLKDLFCDAWQYSEKMGHFSPVQRQGVVTLIPKPGKDKQYVTNYRPITLLNADYKIVSKAVNNRIKLNLHHLVKADQNGFIKGRFIGDNLRLLFDIIDYADFYKCPGAILSLDIYKAFDTIEWNFIYAVLHTFGFGEKLIHWIKCCYCNPTSKLINNNQLSCEFKIERGVRQGDPLSPTLFVLCIECLAAALRLDDEIGLNLNGIDFKVSLLADDTLVFLNGDVSNFDKAFSIINEFGLMSGCKINIQKSVAFFIGSKRSSLEKPYLDKGLSWPQTYFRYLGINFPITGSPKELFQLNFAGLIDKTKAILNIWSGRGLTLIGRVCILKSLIIPTLTYKVNVVPTELPEAFVKNLKRIFFKFIWNSNWEKVKRAKLCCNIEDGGINMFDLDAYLVSLDIKWVNRLFNNSYASPWKDLETSVGSPSEFNSWLNSSVSPNSKLFLQSIPLRTLRKAVSACKKFAKLTNLPANVYRPLWLNKEVRSRLKPFYMPPLIRAGILSHLDLLNNDGDYYTYDELALKFNFQPTNQDFTYFIKLVAAIPDNWDINDPQTNRVPPETKPSWLHTIALRGTVKETYNFVKEHTSEPPTQEQKKWETDIGISTEKPNWREVYRNTYNCTLETKLRAFQIKLNLRAVITNNKL